MTYFKALRETKKRKPY